MNEIVEEAPEGGGPDQVMDENGGGPDSPAGAFNRWSSCWWIGLWGWWGQMRNSLTRGYKIYSVQLISAGSLGLVFLVMGLALLALWHSFKKFFIPFFVVWILVSSSLCMFCLIPFLTLFCRSPSPVHPSAPDPE